MSKLIYNWLARVFALSERLIVTSCSVEQIDKRDNMISSLIILELVGL